ncbi:MAG: phosphatase PAP2 family protein [Oscillospiraceae bacterium]
MSFLYALESIRLPFLDTLMALITQLGGEMVYMAVAVTVFWCVSKGFGCYMLATGFLGTIVNQFLKIFCRVPRPWVIDGNFTIVESAREAASGYSFPSGHTQNAFSSFGCIARWTKRLWLRVLCVVIILLVAFSRMYLGVHTPLDVGVGALMGAVFVLALYPIFRDAEEKPGKVYAAFSALLLLTVGYLVYLEVFPFPADVDAANMASALKNGYNLLGAGSAMLLCFHLDRRYIHFSTEAVFSAQVVKTLAGLAILVALKSLLKAPLLTLFGGSDLANAVRYFIVVFFAAGIWPLTFPHFSAWGKKNKD